MDLRKIELRTKEKEKNECTNKEKLKPLDKHKTHLQNRILCCQKSIGINSKISILLKIKAESFVFFLLKYNLFHNEDYFFNFY